MTVRADFEAMTHDAVAQLAAERRDQPTDRAREAQRELRRRRVEAAALRDREVAKDALGAVTHWSMALHPETWEEWAELARLALDFTAAVSARGLRMNPETGALAVRIPPRGAYWTFWPPHDAGGVPPAHEALAWALARRASHV